MTFAAWFDRFCPHEAAPLLRRIATLEAQRPNASAHLLADVEHDIGYLNRVRPPRFAWGTYRYGTWCTTTAWSSPAVSPAEFAARVFEEDPNAKGFWWDGSSLWHLQPTALVAQLVQHAGPKPRPAKLVVPHAHRRDAWRIVRWAHRSGHLPALLACLRQLRQMKRSPAACRLWPDRRGYSFDWQLTVPNEGGDRVVMNGGLIFHGDTYGLHT